MTVPPPVWRPLGLATQPLELAAHPANDLEIDPLQGMTQLRSGEARRLNTELSVKWLTGRKPILQPWFDALGKAALPEE